MQPERSTSSTVTTRHAGNGSSDNHGQIGWSGVHYEIFVRSFADSNGDGIGDLNGVTNNLDYLKGLGISAIWLMPISPSPTYHKYDVTDYYGIDPDYGTMDDFRRLISEAHQRGIAVIIDLVIHHTSVRHPWFQEAAKGPDNPYWHYYKWLKPDEIKRRKLATRDITADSGERSPWHSVRGARYTEQYYAMFWSGMPDLNFDHQPVRDAVFAIARYWLNEVGVDGFRLDAARHLYRESEEPKNHEFWTQFGQVVEAATRGDGPSGAYTVGEVWTRPDRIAPYFRGLKANFNFDLQLMLTEIVRKENDTEDLIEYLSYVHATFSRVNPNFIDALLLSNHDQNRIGSLVKGKSDQQTMARLNVAANLLLTLPGLPYVYYGEEIGMLGMKPDESIREPFLWDIRAKDTQRTRWRRGTYSTSQTVRPVAQQEADPESLLNHYKRLIQFRNSHSILNNNLSRLVQVGIRQKGILAFIRQESTNDQRVLVVHNLTGKPIDVVLSPTEEWCRRIVFATAQGSLLIGDTITIPAYSCVVVE
ncbi:alpha-amylase family glycosyl hydrolase [Spirosoma agri]|uniref:Alpha-amylase n=1 Tax=Spirosoma agri TaxID=1987381 RepID=A0A6M0IET7_9BACT|nr:alpha-amylase family glycosyl hydrolase [Spirosoma agri]NEU66789.1 alpha-amylase [Spirosoma agri]